MKVLLTGGRGLLGTATALALHERGHTVTTFQRTATDTPWREVLGDVCDGEAVKRAVDGQDAVIHSAAHVSLSGPWQQFEETNIEGTRIMLEQSRAAGVRSFVQVSSPSVAHAGASLIGVDALPADPVHARGNYARSKALAETLALQSSDESMAVCAIRPHLVWGPGDTQLIGRIVDRARSGRLALIGSGRALIDTTYVDNAASALAAAVERAGHAQVRGQAFVVTNGEPRTVAELVGRILACWNLEAPTRSVPYPVAHLAGTALERVWRAGEPPMTAFLAEQLATSHWFDQRRTRRALEWSPQVSLDEGFRRLRAAARRA